MYCQQWEYEKVNEDKFRQYKSTDAWEENYCGVNDGIEAAGAVALFAHSVNRLLDCVLCITFGNTRLSYIHYKELSHIL
jgi:hypothetical protein